MNGRGLVEILCVCVVFVSGTRYGLGGSSVRSQGPASSVNPPSRVDRSDALPSSGRSDPSNSGDTQVKPRQSRPPASRSPGGKTASEPKSPVTGKVSDAGSKSPFGKTVTPSDPGLKTDAFDGKGKKPELDSIKPDMQGSKTDKYSADEFKDVKLDMKAMDKDKTDAYKTAVKDVFGGAGKDGKDPFGAGKGFGKDEFGKSDVKADGKDTAFKADGGIKDADPGFLKGDLGKKMGMEGLDGMKGKLDGLGPDGAPGAFGDKLLDKESLGGAMAGKEDGKFNVKDGLGPSGSDGPKGVGGLKDGKTAGKTDGKTDGYGKDDDGKAGKDSGGKTGAYGKDDDGKAGKDSGDKGDKGDKDSGDKGDKDSGDKGDKDSGDKGDKEKKGTGGGGPIGPDPGVDDHGGGADPLGLNNTGRESGQGSGMPDMGAVGIDRNEGGRGGSQSVDTEESREARVNPGVTDGDYETRREGHSILWKKLHYGVNPAESSHDRAQGAAQASGQAAAETSARVGGEVQAPPMEGEGAAEAPPR